MFDDVPESMMTIGKLEVVHALYVKSSASGRDDVEVVELLSDRE